MWIRLGARALLQLSLWVLSLAASPGKKHDNLPKRALSEEERLMEHLFKDYNPSARPVINSNNSVEVQIMYSLLHIQDLDVRSQILTSTGLLIIDWTDERLTWNKTEFRLEEIVIEASYLWVPEFAVINGAEEIYGDYKRFRAILTYQGHVHWEPGGVFRTMCDIDITYFPFDSQACSWKFGAWSYHTTKMNLTNSATVVNMDSYERNGEWDIFGSSGTRKEFSYACCPNERFSFVQFTIHMQRRHTFYVMNVILPSLVTSVLLLSIFFCPPGQKVQIGVVVLLSFRIFLLNVTDTIPKTSDHIPLLGIYLTCTMAVTTLSMVLTVLVLNLYGITDRPVPRWLDVILLRYLARLLCMCCDDRPKKKRGFRRTNASSMHNSILDEDSEEQTPIIALNGSVRGNTTHETSFTSPWEKRVPPSPQNKPHPGSSKDRESEPEPPDYSKDWQRVAEVVDRFLFWLFLIFIVAISLILFHPLTQEFFRRFSGGTENKNPESSEVTSGD